MDLNLMNLDLANARKEDLYRDASPSRRFAGEKRGNAGGSVRSRLILVLSSASLAAIVVSLLS